MADDVPEPSENEASESVPPAPSAATKKADRRPRLFALGLLVPLLLACSCGGCSLLGRGWIAGVLAARMLAERGVTCDDLDVDLTLALDHATLAPTVCHVESGALDTIELVDPVDVDVVLFAPTHVRAGEVRLGLRGDAPSVDSGALGPVAALFSRIPERIGLLVRATSEIAAMHPPPIEVATLAVVRGEHPSVSIADLALSGDAPLVLGAREVTLPALDGPLGAHADVRIDALHGEASADEVTLTGTIHVDGSAPLMGELHRDGEVTVVGSALTSAEPSYAIRL